MKLLKKIASGILCVTVTLSLMTTVLAKPSIYAPQNNPDGNPFAALQLGDWTVDTQGNYTFLYSVDPFKNQTARDKGLIPYGVQGKYENPSKWAEYEVVKAAKMGLSNMDFITQYQEDITRAEFARGIVQAYYKYDEWLDGNKEVPTNIETDIFDDINVEKNPDDLALIHAYYLGIIEGWDGNYHPELKITRQDMATIVGRFVELYDFNTLTNKDLKNYYQDYKEVSSYAKKYVAGLSNDKIFKGYPVSNNTDIGKDEVSNYEFQPKTYTTNEQALCLILRTVEKYLDPQVSHILGQAINAKIKDGTTILQWNATYGADTYEISKAKLVSDTTYELESTTRTNSTSLELEKYDEDGYPLCDLGSGVFYFFVSPYNEADSGFPSNAVQVIVPHPVEKDTILISDNGNGTANLEWENVADFTITGGGETIGATRYRIVIRENGTNKLLEDKFVNEAAGDTTSMTLNEPLVDNIGTFNVTIYAYNEEFASAPTTALYKVSEESTTEQIQDTILITPVSVNDQLDNNIQTYSVTGAAVAYPLFSFVNTTSGATVPVYQNENDDYYRIVSVDHDNDASTDNINIQGTQYQGAYGDPVATTHDGDTTTTLVIEQI